MKRISRACALTSESCTECDMDVCGCRCHKVTRPYVPKIVKRRYHSEQYGAVWAVFDRGTVTKSSRLMAECATRKDAFMIQQALNKQRRS